MNHDKTDSDVAPAVTRDRRVPAMIISGAVAAVLAVAALTIPVPYVVESPGPAINTIGRMDDSPIITITGKEDFPAVTGALDLTTVRLAGGLPGNSISFFDALKSWLTPSHTIYPAELIYAPGSSQEVINSENSAAMTGSQENATAAALTALGIEFESNLAVASIPDDGAAAGILKTDDVLLALDGQPVADLAQIQSALASGKGAEVDITVLRNGEKQTHSVTPRPGDEGKYLLGVTLQNTFNFPFDVQISLENIGGPSAGLIFALGIMDNLTPGELTGGKHFAGTGTIDPDGKVGAIGGIAQKMVGARSGGADYFLAPADNCQDVIGHIPDGLEVFRAATLKEAFEAVSVIGSGKDSSSLPTCG